MWSDSSRVRYLPKTLEIAVNALLDFVYPACCILCNDPLREHERTVCASCWGKLQVIRGPKCRLCGCPLLEPSTRCDNCRSWEVRFEKAVVLFAFSDMVRDMVHLLKYRGRRSLGLKLGRMLAEVASDEEAIDSMNYLVPIPLHSSRRRERGYNQSTLIAEGMSGPLQIPVRADLVIRKKNTRQQAKLNSAERRTNLAAAFQVTDQDQTEGKQILLIDDIMTTGSTLDSCSQALLDAGAKRVWVAAVASPFQISVPGW